MRFTVDSLRAAAWSTLVWTAYSLLFAGLLSIPDLVIYLQDKSFQPSLKSFNFTASLSAVAPYLWRFSLSSLVGLKDIDYWRDAMSKADGALHDGELPQFAEKLLDGGKEPVFAVINPRVAHVPYISQVPESHRKYSRQAGLMGLELRRAQYDDAIGYFDHVVTESLEVMLKKIRGPVVVLLISDHGERLGEGGGKLGHGVVHFDVGKTPFMIFQRGDGSDEALKKIRVRAHIMISAS